MKSASNWPTDLTVAYPNVLVQLDYHDTDVISVSWEASTQGLRPSGQSAARTGTIQWAPFSVIETKASWMPRRGQRIDIYEGYNGAYVKTFTGKIRKSKRDSNGVTSEIVDDFDRLSSRFTLEPVMSVLPPLNPAGDKTLIRYPMLSSVWFVNRAAAVAGFHATPPAVAGDVFSASLCGSLIPEAGMLDATGAGLPNNWQRFGGGFAPRGFWATYKGYGNPPSGGFQFRAMRAIIGTPGQEWTVTGGNGVKVTVNGSGLVQLSGPSGTIGQYTLPAAATQVQVDWGTDGYWWIGDESGYTASGFAAATPAGSSVWTISSANDGPAMAGVSVGYGAGRARGWFTPTFIQTRFAPIYELRASRSIINRPAREVLDEIAQAEGASYWVDCDGILRWADWLTGRDRAVQTTLRSTNALLDIGIASDWDSVAARVALTYTTAMSYASPNRNITCYQGTGDSLAAGDGYDQIIHPPDDTEWVQVDPAMSRIGVDTVSRWNERVGSWGGGVSVAKADGTEYIDRSYHMPSYAYLDPRSFRVSAVVVDTMPSTLQIQLRAPDSGTFAASNWGAFPATRLEKLPIIRCAGKATFTQNTYTSPMTGPIEGVGITVDAASWVQSDTQAKAIGDAWATILTQTTPTLMPIAVVPDARIEIGDFVRVVDTHRIGVSALGTVVGIRSESAEGRASQTLTIATAGPGDMSVDADPRTYATDQQDRNGMTYAAVDNAVGNQTYAQEGA